MRYVTRRKGGKSNAIGTVFPKHIRSFGSISEKTVKSVRFETNRSSCTPSVVIASVVTENLLPDPNLSNGYTYSDAVVKDGSVSLDVVSPVNSTAILAVYSNEECTSLVAVDTAVLTTSAPGAKLTALNDTISADGNYTIKLFMWDGTETIRPVYNAVPLN